MMRDMNRQPIKVGQAVYALFQASLELGVVIRVNPKSVTLRLMGWRGNNIHDTRKTDTERYVIIATKEQIPMMCNQSETFKEQYEMVQKIIQKMNDRDE